MELSLSHCHVFVHDPDAALSFYRDALGLTVRNDVSNDGYRWVTLSPPSQPDVEIVLSHPEVGRSPEDGKTMMELLAKGSLAGVNLRTPDLDTLYEKVAASGAEVLQEPADQFWGARDCAFRDPSGNMVRIAQA